MKRSRYIEFLRDDKRIYAMNLMNLGVVSFRHDSIDEVNYLLDHPDRLPKNDHVVQLKKMLSDNGFLIDDDLDELAVLKERHGFQKNMTRNFCMQIAVTMDCNFRCPYCYEQHEKVSLSRDKQDSIINYVRSNIKKWDNLDIIWFGGEPLLQPNIIKHMSNEIIKICQQHSVNFQSFIITNGYLLTPENAGLLKSCNVKIAQITIDGDQDTHNQRRFLVNGRGTYGRIVKNILDSYSYFEGYLLRVNIDDQPVEKIIPVIRDLLPVKDKIQIGFFQADDVGECLSARAPHSEYVAKATTLNTFALDNGFKIITGNRFPGTCYCPAYVDNCLLVDARGDLHRCVTDTGNPDMRTGYFDDGGNIVRTDLMSRYDFDPFKDPDCLACNSLPFCMGGCPKFPVNEKSDHGRCMAKENLCSHLSQQIFGQRNSNSDLEIFSNHHWLRLAK